MLPIVYGLLAGAKRLIVVGRPVDRRADKTLGLRHHRGIIIPDRRIGYDRRRTTLWTFMQGGLTPRRRGGRRVDEQHLPIDWHEPHLLFLALTILLLNVTDAFLTLTLMTAGAREANPLLAFVLNNYPKLFVAIKMTLTSGGILVLVAMARACVFRLVRVGSILHSLLMAYAALIFYEWWLLRSIP